MRPVTPAIALATVLALAPAARAAPTCQDRIGDDVRCGSPGAMPVGWTASPRMALARQAAEPPDPTPSQALGLVALIGALFALIALMPDFDGWDAGDWGQQEGDDDERRRRGRREGA
jgi:hypothetical protein